ncbi:MAG: hypothetical protein ACOYU3_09780 [Bacillota bacterium]
MIILITLAFIMYAVYQIPRLVKKKHWSDLAVFCGLFAIAYGLCMMLALGIEITSPAKAVEGILNALNLHY